jgi:hypothetical protein
MVNKSWTVVPRILWEFIKELKKKNQILRLANKAEALTYEYRNKEELTAFTLLDSEDVV